MSRIYFHAKHREAEVGGSERAYFAGMASDIALTLLRLDPGRDAEWVSSITVNPPDYITEALNAPKPDVMVDGPGYQRWARWVDTWSTWARVSWGEGGIRVAEHTLGFMDMALNTLVAMNSPQLAFAAHVHGCCESHGWVPAENAAWLADLIEHGREHEVFRAGQGWEDVVALAREVDDDQSNGPIVMSYSVCDGFPNRYVIGEPWFYPWSKDAAGELVDNPQDEAAEERWYALSDHERWDTAVAALTASEWPFPMGPDRQTQGFMSGHSVFDLMATRWSGQLAGRDG